MKNTFTVFVLLLLFCCCCRSEKEDNRKQGEKIMELKVTSPAFEDGSLIPAKYTADGQNISPPLKWSAVPQGAKTIAIINDDPDAPMGTWVHWIIWNIPSAVSSLDENTAATEQLPGGARQGKTDFGSIGYGGPAPPSGTHRYFFKVYALDCTLKLPAEATKKQLEQAMSSHILAQGQLVGKYKRQRYTLQGSKFPRAKS